MFGCLKKYVFKLYFSYRNIKQKNYTIKIKNKYIYMYTIKNKKKGVKYFN